MSRGIYSTYLTPAEEEAIKRLAAANGTSVNFVVRVAVRKLLGLSAPELAPPAAKPANRTN